MRKKILRTSSIFAVLAALVPAAHAACVTTGADTDCTGTTTGQQSFGGDDQTVTVEPGAIVTSADSETVTIGGDRLELINNGDILNTGSGLAIRMSSTNGPTRFVNSGLVQSTAGNGAIIDVTVGDLTVDNSGTIETLDLVSGSFTGLIARTQNGNVSVTNSGTITGLDASTFSGNASVTNTGTLAGGGFKDGLSVVATGDVTILNAGQVSGGFRGINTVSYGGATRIENQGTIASTGSFGAGISSRISDASATGTILNSGEIDSANAGISVAFDEADSVSVTNSGMITTREDSSRNRRSSGIVVSGDAGLNGSTVTVTNTVDGEITTLGRDGNGVTVTIVGEADVVAVNDGAISTSGLSADGLGATTGTGSADAKNTGTIEATSAASFGVSASAGTGNATATNSGTIRATATGLRATSRASGDATVVNSGDINAGAAFSAYAQSGTATSVNDGTAQSQYSSGAFSLTGDASATNTGTLQSATISAGALTAASYSGTASVINSGDIVQSGAGGAGLATYNLGYTAETATFVGENSGSIVTTGDNSAGIRSFLYTGGYGAVVNMTATNSVDGTISTSGNGSHGIEFDNPSSGDIISSNAGSIDTTGVGSFGVSAYTADGSASFTNTGTITTTGDGSRGFSSNVNGNALITNQGTISVAGNGSGNRGISANQIDGGEGSIVNTDSGTITVTGDGVFGLYALGQGGAVTIQNDGAISVDGTGAKAVSALSSSGDLSITNSGAITATGTDVTALSGYSAASINIVNTGDISSDGQALSFYSYGAALSLTSSGEITGDIDLQDTIDTITISGVVDGQILLGALDDSLIYSGDETGSLNGNLFGGAGTDALTFAGTGASLFSSAASDFETVAVTGLAAFDGASFIGGDAFSIGATGGLAIGRGGTAIEAANGVSHAGRLALAPGATLNISGGGFSALSGSTTIFGVDTATPQILADGAIDFSSGSQIEINVLDVDTLFNGRTFDAAVSGTSLTDASGDLIDNSLLFDFIKEVVGGDTLRISMSQALQIDEVVDPADASAVGAALGLQSIVDGSGTAGVGLSTLFGQLPDDASVANGVEQFLPGDSGGIHETATFAASAATSTIMDNLQHRASSRVQSDTVERGAFTLWGDYVAGRIDGDADGYQAEYDGSVSGFVGGLDRAFLSEGSETLIGLSLFSIDGDVNEDTAANNDSDIESFGVSVYGEVKSGPWRGFAQAGFSDIDVSTQRANALLAEVVSSDYSGSQSHLTGVLDYTISQGDWQIIPRGELNYVATDFDRYNETVSLGALSIGDQSSSSTTARFEIEATTLWNAWDSAALRPDVRASVSSSSMDNDPLQAQFTDGGDAFAIALAERDGGAVGFGAGLSLDIQNGLSVRLSYDGDFADAGTRQIARLRVATQF